MSSLRRADEFPLGADDWPNELSRRRFLKLMGASIALASTTACTRNPLEHIVPYQKQPEEIIPGKPLFYASALTLGGYARGVLVETPRRPADQDRGQPAASRQPRRERCLHAGGAARRSTIPSARRRCCTRADQHLGDFPRRDRGGGIEVETNGGAGLRSSRATRPRRLCSIRFTRLLGEISRREMAPSTIRSRPARRAPFIISIARK